MRVRVEGHDLLEPGEWQAAFAAPDEHPNSAQLDRLDWQPARVPGTGASALASAGLWEPGDARDFDSEDWWFRTTLAGEPAEPGEQVSVCFGGLATVAEVYLNGELLLESESMFQAHELDIGGQLQRHNELAIRFRALSKLLREPRRPRARWRTRVVADGNLRFFRTTMLGRAPGFAPHPAPVGPWRPVRVVRRRRLAVDSLRLVPALSDDVGTLEATARLRSLGAEVSHVMLSVGDHTAELSLERCDSDALVATGTIQVPSVAQWWPHTHGSPQLYDVSMTVGCGSEEVEIDAGRIGFRDLRAGASTTHDVEQMGLDLHVNGERIFCRGAIWTPIDPVGLSPSRDELRESLEVARNAGVNMLRVAGTGVYESEDFHDLCDELGLLVWQDFMFANLDYPFASEPFERLVVQEAEQVLASLHGRPSLAVLCGNSEIEQQVGMLGLDPVLGRGAMFTRTLPDKARAAGVDAVYVPSAPYGGELPFRPDAGVANYFGVGAYLRPVEDARRAGVRFASECLAFSNVPDESGVDAVSGRQPASIAMHDPRWKRGVPRDVGAGWDFEDVRDHYLESLFGIDARELRSIDQARYLELSRAVTGELIAEVFGEWRRQASPCGGGIVLWWRDLLPGAGWGLVDHDGNPKLAYYHLRRAVSPIAVWTTDEGLGGVQVHLANDGPAPLDARLRVALYRGGETRIAEASETLALSPRGSLERSVEGLLGHFVDAAWAYRFGPPAHDVIFVSLEADAEPGSLLAQAVRFPAGRPVARTAPGQMGIEAEFRPRAGGGGSLALKSDRLAYGVRIHAAGLRAEDQGFCLEPGHERRVELRPASGASADPPAISLTALNLDGSVKAGVGGTR